MSTAQVFLSYSHADERWKDRLLVHLRGLEAEGLLSTWNDRDLAAGDDWLAKILGAIKGARVAVILVSPDFLASKFILGEEVPRLLERRERDGLVVFPVLVRSCVWQNVSWLSPIQARPRGDKSLAAFKGDRRDAEMAKIAKEILGILRGTSGLEPSSPRRDLEPATERALASLRQLPPPPADFTGREVELAELRAAIAAGGRAALFGLRGMGGVGKTALALYLAESVKPLYPDAQIYLDLLGVAPTPLSAAQAMAHVIRAFHPEARLPEDAAELAGVYRSVLDGKRVLLLMDNAGGRDQVEPLVPPAGCALLVTSRFKFHLPGLQTKGLDELPEEEACAMLRTIAPRIGAEAAGIARLCGGLPIALRLAGSALAEREDLTPADYARRLASARQRFGEVDASLGLSCELLSENLRGLWRRLGVFPGSFDGAAVSAVWGVEADPAGDALGELVRASLVLWEGDRYRLHDLARLFAAGRLSAEERADAERRHARHYLDVLRQANSLYKEGGDALPRGLRLFDAEWGNIQAGQAWAVAQPPEDDEAGALSSGYPDAGTYLLDVRQHPGERIQWREAALEAARRRNDRSAEGVHLGNLGNAYVALGEPRRAIEIYEQRLEIARQIGDRRGEGQALGNLGIAYAALGEPRRAIELYEQGLEIARQIGDRRGEANALGSLGIAHAARGEPRRAIELYEQWLEIARQIGDRRREGQALGSLGLAYAALGEPRRAIELYEQRLEIARQIGDRRGEASASWNLGLVYEKDGDLERAVALMQVCVDFERSIGHPDAEPDAARVAAIRARIAGGSAGAGEEPVDR